MDKLELSKKLTELVDNDETASWVIDGGCHDGLLSLELANIFPKSRIIAYEPAQPAFDAAVGNTLALQDRITVIKTALGAERGRADLFTGPMPATNSLLPRPHTDLKTYYPPQASFDGRTTVDVVTLDEECLRYGIKEIELLKLDLQGGELLALNGTKSMLESGKIKVVLCECVFIEKYRNQPLLWQICHFLDSFGYSLYSLEDRVIGFYDKSDQSLRQGQWNQCDVIFISQSVRLALDRKHK